MLLGDGLGGFAVATTFPTGPPFNSVAVGDFNGDPKLDLAVASPTNGSVSVLLGTGTGGFGVAIDFPVGEYPISVAVEDFNGDRKLDLAVGIAIDNTIGVLLNQSQ